MSIINTNTISLNAQRNLANNSATLATTIQRLSSGLRINSAKDDAAGLAISERFTTQIRGLNQAVRNANDGISLAQTTEGALGEIGNNLQRIRELAVQARNFTNSPSDRAALQSEVALRLQEIDRTAFQTSFNGQKVLDGSFQNAAFQIGANAGETISVSINANARLTALGKVASATSSALQDSASGGTITRTASTLNFAGAGSPATSGRVVAQIDSVNFGAATSVGSTGAVQFTAAAFDFRQGSNTTAPITDIDYSGGALNLAQFNVTANGSTATITLDQSYASVGAMAAVIQAQIQSTTGLSNVTVAESAGALVFTNAGAAGAVAISATDTVAQGAGFADTAGTAGSAQPRGTFTVSDGTNSVDVVLTTQTTDVAGLVSELNTQFGASFTASASGNVVSIVNATGGAAVNITAANASANQAGVANATGTAGTAATTSNAGGFQIENGATDIDIVLDQDYGSFSAVQTAIQTQLDTAAAGAFSVSIDSGGVMTLRRSTTGASSAAVVINSEVVNPAAQSTIAGLGTSSAGADAVTSTNGSFQVDGTTVTLNQSYASAAALRTAIAGQLTGYSVTGTGSDIIITNNASGSSAVTISNADPNAFTAGFANGAGTAGTMAGAITLTAGELSINGTAIVGSFANREALNVFINSNVQGVFASNDGAIGVNLKSADAITLAGSQASALFGATAFEPTNGSLDGLSITTAEGADDALMRLEAALATINGARADLGAIQNRFESVIANLGTTVENLSSSRSRIRDADYARETAELTRTQILQQAGTAMLAQANQIPQNVLSLLRQ